LISIYSDGGELNGLTIVDAAGNSVVNQVDCRFVGRYRFADTLRSERNGPVFANYRTDFEDDYTRVCEYVTEFSELNDTTDYTKTPGRIVYFGGNDEFWYVNQNGYWSNHNDKIEQIAGDSAAAAQSRAEDYADGLVFSAGSFSSKDTTVTTDFTVTVANVYTVTSFCDDGADNTIFLPTPVDSLKGNVVEVAHLDTSAAQSRTTTVETDGTSYHIYDNFTGDTLTFFNIYQSGQTVRFTLKEIEGVLRWAAVNLSPVVFGDKELTAVGKIRQGEDGDLYAYDSSVSGERKVQYQYTVKNKSDLLTTKAQYGDIVIVADTFGLYSPYLFRLDSLESFTVDSVAVIPSNSGYWHMLPAGGDKYMYSQFRELGEDGGEVVNNALLYIYQKAVYTRNLANVTGMGQATDSVFSISGSLFIDQQVYSSTKIEIPNMVELTGNYKTGPVLEGSLSRPFPGIIFNMPNASDTCITFVDKNLNESSVFYRSGRISNLILTTESQVSRIIYADKPAGNIIENILVNGQDQCHACLETTGTIFTHITNSRFTRCDTSIHISNNITSTSLYLTGNSVTRNHYGVVIDPYANGSGIHMDNMYTESCDSSYIYSGPGNSVYINGFESESGTGGSAFKVGFGEKNISKSANSVFSVKDARITGVFDYAFLMDTISEVSCYNCYISTQTADIITEFKGTSETKSLTLIGGRSDKSPFDSSKETFGLIDSLDASTNISISNYNKIQGSSSNLINYQSKSTPKLLKIDDGGEIEIEVEGPNPGVLKLGDRTFAVDNSIPINLQIANTEGIGYEKIYYSLMEAQNGGKITPNYSLIRFSNLSEDNTNDDNAVYTSEIDLRHGPNNLNVVSGYQTLSLFQNQTHTGNVSELNGFYLPRFSTINGTYNITDFSGLRIKGFNQISSNVNITNSYGIKIDDQNPFNDPDFNNVFAIHTGTGLVRFGDNLQLSTYGSGNKSATDLSKTGSGYLSEYATDGTLLESALTVADFDTLQRLTGWAQYTDDQYTSVSPLNVAAGDTVTLFNNAASTITSDLPIGIDSLWNRTDSTIIGQYVGDAYTIRIDFTAESSSNDGYFDLGVDIGGTQNIIFQRIYAFPKGQDTPHRFSSTNAIYTLDTFIANGGKIKIIGGVGTTEIYDVNFVITRTHASPD
jgi:hypothetical protein